MRATRRHPNAPATSLAHSTLPNCCHPFCIQDDWNKDDHSWGKHDNKVGGKEWREEVKRVARTLSPPPANKAAQPPNHLTASTTTINPATHTGQLGP